MAEPFSGEPRQERSMRSLLSLPGYSRLVSAYGLNEFGWFFGTIALSVLVYRRTDSALGSAGFFLCSQAAPGLIGPVFVSRLDRLSPRTVLPILYWCEALLFALLAWLVGRFSLAPVLSIVVLDGVLALAARSLADGARTEILKPLGAVREGGALNSIVFSVAYLLGPVLGGVVTSVGGTATALLVSGGLFAVMGGALVSRSLPRRIVHEGPERGRLRAALRHIRGDRAVVTLLTLQTLVLICFTIPAPIMVVYAVHTMHVGSFGYGVLLSVWGGAALVGSITYARWRRGGARQLLGSAIALAGSGFAVMAVAPDFGIALVGAGIGGVSNGLGSVAFRVEFQEIVPQSWIALAGSVNQALVQLAPGIGTALGGGLAALVSVRFALGVAGTASLAFAGVAIVVLSPARYSRTPDRGGSGTDAGSPAGGDPSRPPGEPATEPRAESLA